MVLKILVQITETTGHLAASPHFYLHIFFYKYILTIILTLLTVQNVLKSTTFLIIPILLNYTPVGPISVFTYDINAISNLVGTSTNCR